MYQNDPELDQRLSRFEAQLDRFSLALHQWHQTQEQAPTPTPHDVDQRMRTIEETVDREVHTLRRMHEEPLKQLEAQTASLRDICAAAAHSVNGLDQAESRLAAIQADVHLHLTELSRSLQTLVADLRIGASSAVAAQGPAAAWPLDRVVHLHDELRRGANGRDATSPPTPTPPDGTDTRVGRGSLFEQASSDGTESSRPAWIPGGPRTAWYAAGAAVLVAGLLLYLFAHRIESRLNDAGVRVTAAEREAAAATQLANREIVVAREEANKQIAEARQSAQRAEAIGAVLTAPDLARFTLAGGSAVERSSAQVLWSRTRGLVLSASRLPPAPPETVYQLWLTTSTAPVSAGLFVPDGTGRATLVVDPPPRVAGPVLGAQVTVEPSGGRPAPSGRTLLVRLP